MNTHVIELLLSYLSLRALAAAVLWHISATLAAAVPALGVLRLALASLTFLGDHPGDVENGWSGREHVLGLRA